MESIEDITLSVMRLDLKCQSLTKDDKIRL